MEQIQIKRLLLVGLCLILSLVVSVDSLTMTNLLRPDIDLVQGNTGVIIVYYSLPMGQPLKMGNWEYSIDGGRSWNNIPPESLYHSPANLGLPTGPGRLNSILAWNTQQIDRLRTVVPQLQLRVQAYDPNPSQAWQEMPSTLIPRQGHTTVTWQDRIYTFGGWNGCRLTSSAEFYDISSNGWYKVDSMPTPRQHLTAVAVDGVIYAIGGVGRTGNLAVVEAYDPQLNRWATQRPMPTPRRALAATVVDGRIYAVGGHNGTSLTTVEIYDPATDSWMTGTQMPAPRHSMGLTTLGGKIYVIGGFNGRILKSVLVYDPKLDQWQQLADLQVPRYGLTAVRHQSLNQIYAIGGRPNRGVSAGGSSLTHSSSGTGVEVLTVNQLNSELWRPFVPLQTGRICAGAVLLSDQLYIIGGTGKVANWTAETLELESPTGYAETKPIILQNSLIAELQSPKMFAEVKGDTTVFGQIGGQEAERWTLDIAPFGLGDFQSISQGLASAVISQSTDNELGRWNTSGLSDGLYLVRLQVFHSANVAPNSPAETYLIVRLQR